MTRTRQVPPRTVRVRYEDQEYDRDLARCRSALFHRQVEGAFDNVAGLARLVALSEGTVHGFLAGRMQCSREAVERILSMLDLSWNDVHSPASVDGGAADGGRGGIETTT